MTDATGKPCPQCQAPMSDLRSMQQRLCTACGHAEAWTLSDGQPPLIGPSRQKKAPR